MSIRPVPEVGQIVKVRSRQFLVEDIVLPKYPNDAHLLKLACVDDDASGQELHVLWESELDTHIISGGDWSRVAREGFDSPAVFSSWLNTMRWNCVTATDARLFQAPFRAGIHLDAYQLEPLRKALQMPRVNLFIADDVGLGKTIEAGLIARELLLRKKIRDIVVSCPPSVLPQWQNELEQRFGLTFVVLDRDYLARIRRERGYAANAWNTHTRFLVSHKLLIDETYAGGLRDWLGDFRTGSLLILDEAHHAAPSTNAHYATDSKFTRIIRDLAHRFEHRLFLSATPHNGHSNSFSALLEILDPQRFCRGVQVSGKTVLRDVLVRRLKEDIRVVNGGFPKRIVEQIDIDGLPADAPELRLSALLNDYRTRMEARLKQGSKSRQTLGTLLLIGLQQRLLSSIRAFARTLKVHQKSVLAGPKSPVAEPTPGLFDRLSGTIDAEDDRAVLPAEDLDREEEIQIDKATQATVGQPTTEELRLLTEMRTLADAHSSQPDARLRWLESWIKREMLNRAQWQERRILIFTEYEDTLVYLRDILSEMFADTDRADDRIAIYRGCTSTAEREEIKRAFNGDYRKYPVRILLATDAAREGINLQSRCADLFHFDVPWNPGRMEQRNGRIDRKLQPAPEVRCHYFVYRQRPEDRILKALVRKTQTIREQLGSLSQVIEGKLAVTLQSQGIAHQKIDWLNQQIEAADLEKDSRAVIEEELEAARERQDELRTQIEGLRTQLERSQNHIGLKREAFQAALSNSLTLFGASPLTATTNAKEFTFPPVDTRAGGDASWADTLDSLRTPREKGQTVTEWRRDSRLRPIVFEDSGTITDEVVHLHLEHRVVQRLLSRFTSQGFVHHDLSRACFAQSRDSIRRVILIGRLCLYGNSAARLHEELIFVTARWTEKQLRKEPLSPYATDAERNTLQLLETAMADPGSPPNEIIRTMLQATSAQDIRELLPSLKKRADEVGEGATIQLRERGEKEAAEMRKILLEQRDRIQKQKSKTNPQQDLFNKDELKQFAADQQHWEQRLEKIGEELASEPERIQKIYTVRATRMEPVGLVYLWPVTG